MSTQLIQLDATTYERHLLHTQDRNWAETNCYVDVWIELLHAWGFEPLAALPFTVAIDFEGDQWTFFKFPHADLLELFGLDVQELAIWRPLASHIDEQLGLGRPVLVELDSFYLPDTAGTSYRLDHVKSTVAAVEIDIVGQRLGYFHGQGYYELHGDDFVNVLRLHGVSDPNVLPPYVEFVKPRWPRQLDRTMLVERSLNLLRRHVHLIPTANPFVAFKQQFAADLEWLQAAPLDMFHQYSFATLRQFGACYEAAASYLKWLTAHGEQDFEQSTASFTALSNGAKTMQFHLARAMARKRPLDLSPLDDMGQHWQTAVDTLHDRVA